MIIEEYNLAFESKSIMDEHDGLLWYENLCIFRTTNHGHLGAEIVDNKPNPTEAVWEYMRTQGIRGYVIVRDGEGDHTKYVLSDTLTVLQGTLTFDEPYAEIWNYVENEPALVTQLRNRPDILPLIMDVYNKATEHMSHSDALGYAISELENNND